MTWVLIVVAAYVVGMFPSAILVARAAGVDITSVGSGNPGAANITRNLGWKRGAWVFVLDAAKVQPQWEPASQSMVGHSPISLAQRQLSGIAIRPLEASTAEKVSQRVVEHLQC